MLARKPLGQGAASTKYDLLTALGALACAGGAGEQRLVLRLITLLTARYNWASGEMAVGRSQLAQLWAVDERTVKREMAKLKTRGWISVTRPAARGRVAAYAVEWSTILADTRPAWENIGPDFTERLGRLLSVEPEPAPKVVPLRPVSQAGDPLWAAACRILESEDAGFFRAWIAPLGWQGREADRVVLRAPSGFHAQYLRSHGAARLDSALCRVDPACRGALVLAP